MNRGKGKILSKQLVCLKQYAKLTLQRKQSVESKATRLGKLNEEKDQPLLITLKEEKKRPQQN